MSRGECSTNTVFTTGFVATTAPGWTGAAFVFDVVGADFGDASALLFFFSILPSFKGRLPPSNVVATVFDAALAASRRRAFSFFRTCRFSSLALRVSAFAALEASAPAAFLEMNDRIASVLVVVLLVATSLSIISCSSPCTEAEKARSSWGAVSLVAASFNSGASDNISSTLG